MIDLLLDHHPIALALLGVNVSGLLLGVGALISVTRQELHWKRMHDRRMCVVRARRPRVMFDREERR